MWNKSDTRHRIQTLCLAPFPHSNHCWSLLHLQPARVSVAADLNILRVWGRSNLKFLLDLLCSKIFSWISPRYFIDLSTRTCRYQISTIWISTNAWRSFLDMPLPQVERRCQPSTFSTCKTDAQFEGKGRNFGKVNHYFMAISTWRNSVRLEPHRSSPNALGADYVWQNVLKMTCYHVDMEC